MTAPVVFTDDEKSALERVHGLANSITKTEVDIATVNRQILRSKNKRDRLVARRDALKVRIRAALELIDTAKNRLPEIP